MKTKLRPEQGACVMATRYSCDVCEADITKPHDAMLLYSHNGIMAEIRVNSWGNRKVQGRENHICHDCLLEIVEKGKSSQAFFNRKKQEAAE